MHIWQEREKSEEAGKPTQVQRGSKQDSGGTWQPPIPLQMRPGFRTEWKWLGASYETPLYYHNSIQSSILSSPHPQTIQVCLQRRATHRISIVDNKMEEKGHETKKKTTEYMQYGFLSPQSSFQEMHHTCICQVFTLYIMKEKEGQNSQDSNPMRTGIGSLEKQLDKDTIQPVNSRVDSCGPQPASARERMLLSVTCDRSGPRRQERAQSVDGMGR